MSISGELYPTDPAAEVVTQCMVSLQAAFGTAVDPPPLGGASNEVRFFAGEGPALAAWTAHTQNGDGCDEPFLWVRVVRRYRSQDFPNPTIAANPCGLPAVINVELGVAHCALTDMTPSWEEYDNEAAISLDDSWRLELAVAHLACGLTDDDHLVGTDTITPYGPEGGILAWTAVVYVSL